MLVLVISCRYLWLVVLFRDSGRSFARLDVVPSSGWIGGPPAIHGALHGGLTVQSADFDNKLGIYVSPSVGNVVFPSAAESAPDR